ncbi:hypothetical protein [Solidesulfovibrio magneticus]|uniref:Uncharacterized protein n=1 Tax=Solidesulfovibrio magneticus (strain ATCC 700980 / DSM 13731 / RS-1) TaxID=573370 RepID=C4XM38_SOLM1|nr:hypothetical protein [Solidesulfovibrio magneticus]BAH77166.1 hypothetical protein DMR_36750 [Solidesulfovibrio magneticus RS-1]
MKNYYAISESGAIRKRFTVTNKSSGKFKLIAEEPILDTFSGEGLPINMLTIVCIDDASGSPVVKKIGTVKTIKFTIEDCDVECVEKMISKFIRTYESNKSFQQEAFEIPQLLELAYSPRKFKNRTRPLSFEEMIVLPVDPRDGKEAKS